MRHTAQSPCRLEIKFQGVVSSVDQKYNKFLIRVINVVIVLFICILKINIYYYLTYLNI